MRRKCKATGRSEGYGKEEKGVSPNGEDGNSTPVAMGEGEGPGLPNILQKKKNLEIQKILMMKSSDFNTVQLNKIPEGSIQSSAC